MGNYDFQTLSPIDFEEFSRDLLQKELGLILESFATGRDGGIDFRYAPDPTRTTIVQCKRYATWRSLLSALKKEVPKANALKPKRYILTTSISLTKDHKKQIAMLFAPHIKKEADILGREDLNNLLGKHPEIERKHFKLWLPSTAVLEKILHSRVSNQTLFELDDLKVAVQLYVQNESFDKATAILNSKRFVIISGAPGVGKTTLARMLVSNCLAGAYENLVVASESINEAYDLYKTGAKQIFFFDDFLGKVFLERPVSKNEDQRIIKFIERVSKSSDKVFILTTREYILAQAKEKLEGLNSRLLDLSKCVVDVAHYTLPVRARMLYNHIFYSKLGKAHVSNLLKGENYLKIIRHPNFSPRIIADTLMIDDVWKGIAPAAFTRTLIEYLDNPEQIWRRAYESQISTLSQCVLANMASAGDPILYEDLRAIMDRFAEKYSHKYGFTSNELEFRKSIRELDGSFILTKKAAFTDDIVVNFYDPSVNDFLINHLAEAPDLVHDVISTACFFNQFFTIFRLQDGDQGLSTAREGRVPLSPALTDVVLDRIIGDFDDLSSSSIQSAQYRPRKSNSEYGKLYDLIEETRGLMDPRLREFILQRFARLQYGTLQDDFDFETYSEIVGFMRLRGDLDDGTSILVHFFDQVETLFQFNKFEELEESFSEAIETLTGDYEFAEKVRELILDEARGRGDDEAGEVLEEAERIGCKYKIYTDDIEERLRERVAEYKDRKRDFEAPLNPVMPTSVQVDLTEVRNMFDSLRGLR